MHASGYLSPRLSTFSVSPFLGGPRRSHADNFTTTSEIPVNYFKFSDLNRPSSEPENGMIPSAEL